MTRLAAIFSLILPLLPAPAGAVPTQVCQIVGTGGPDAWTALTCRPVDRPHGLPQRLRR